LLIVSRPDTEQKIELLSREACFDLSAPDEGYGHNAAAGDPQVAEKLAGYVYRSQATRRPLLKILLSDACQNNCHYCALRAEAGKHRHAFEPEELAAAYVEMYRRGRAAGLFLSSGLAGNSRRTMEKMLRTAEILRLRYRYPGYLHLKILPGATDEYVEAACRLADRVSANLEAPNLERLAVLCPEKQFDGDLLAPLRKVDRIRRWGPAVPYGQTTQFVVGAAGESDRELLETTSRLYAEVRLTRAYFSAFRPVAGTPLEDHPATPLVRQRRLYQADTLLRQYGFAPSELPLDAAGNLPREQDPKLGWAKRHPERFPVEVNRASREELLRVPGIGPRGASAILNARRAGPLSGPDALKALSISRFRACPFLLVNGRGPAPEAFVQGRLWPEER
jgi:predicted DNA-binding helix-hairpin-helix protein